MLSSPDDCRAGLPRGSQKWVTALCCQEYYHVNYSAGLFAITVLLGYTEDYQLNQCLVTQRITMWITVLDYSEDYCAVLPRGFPCGLQCFVARGLSCGLRCWVTQRITMLITVLGYPEDYYVNSVGLPRGL